MFALLKVCVLSFSPYRQNEFLLNFPLLLLLLLTGRKTAYDITFVIFLLDFTLGSDVKSEKIVPIAIFI